MHFPSDLRSISNSSRGGARTAVVELAALELGRRSRAAREALVKEHGGGDACCLGARLEEHRRPEKLAALVLGRRSTVARSTRGLGAWAEEENRSRLLQHGTAPPPWW
jgi:hypothetical protein